MWNLVLKNCTYGTSMVSQWTRSHLPVQGTLVQFPVQEDSTCIWATKPVHHNHWAWEPWLLKPCVLEPTRYNYWALLLQLLKNTCLEPVLCHKRSHHNEKPRYHKSSPCSLQLEKAWAKQWRLSTAKDKLILKTAQMNLSKKYIKETLNTQCTSLFIQLFLREVSEFLTKFIV